MAKTKTPKSDTKLVSGSDLKEIKACRPLRLFINKQKKKGAEMNPLRLRAKFLQLSNEKKAKYYQKSIDKYVELLDEKNISKQTQIDGKLFDVLLSKPEQKVYFQSIDAPTKPFYNAAAYYADEKKQANEKNPKPWKNLTADERKPYTKMLNDSKAEYTAQVKSFSENLPERLKTEYLAFLNPMSNDEESKPGIKERRQSVQSIADTPALLANDNNHVKLTRAQLDDLHKCKPDTLYYEKKYADDDEKPTFANSLAKNAFIRTLFKDASEKKRHKFVLKSTKKWEDFLETHSAVTEQQIPTLHLLLSKQDDIHFYFSSLGLPVRPASTAMFLFQNERQENNSSQQNWADLSQTVKDDYIKRLAKIKNEYHEKFVEFVEKTLPNDYIRLEFFRNVKHAVKDYESSTKDRVHNNNDLDEGQLKITQYLRPKNQLNNENEFNRIKQQLLATNLNSEQKKLVDKLGELMDKFRAEKSSDLKSSTITSKRKSTDSSDVVVINGETDKKKKKKSKDTPTVDETKSSTKKRK